MLPQSPWPYTDDTEMALAIVEVLGRQGRIEQDDLAGDFARRYRANPCRGYGGTAHGILEALGAGVPWQAAAGSVFGGMGSMGNGGAMRVAPLGAYWADDYNTVVVALEHTPPGETRHWLEHALALPPELSVQTAASLLGSGLKVTAPDTLPFALWCAARQIDHYEEALWATVSGLGDRDTTCALVGGVVALATDRGSIPAAWLEAREPLALTPRRPER